MTLPVPAPSDSARPDEPVADVDLRYAARDRHATIRRWAVLVLGLATGTTFLYVAAVGTGAWLVASAYAVTTGGRAVEVDALSLAGDLLPALLVGWCSGLAMVAVLAGGRLLGPRTSGLVAGGVGTVAGGLLLSAAPLL